MIDKREQLLEAAEELFAEHGYEGTSTRMLAKKAGVNVAMVSYYFGSKEKLFEALVEDRAGILREKLLEIQDDKISPVKKIEMVIDYYVDKIFSNRRFHLILHREMTLHQRSGLNEAILNILLKNRQEVAKIIKDGQKKNVFGKSHVAIVGPFFQAFCRKARVQGRLLWFCSGGLKRFP